ncbi:obscurin-like protein 1a isoform X2 [Denticeps clupeoides]|uniref:obscurin-like protein 1a isoform X2 n=1 Tax=Denticeps clupeoides TaxID=299321 RepID=UPI0010A4E2DA|nr:obscurin-like protein 1 isoform X2 [Denticeps clupeoides]
MDVFGGAPRVLSYPRPVVVQSGMDALLQCKIGGDPRPDVFWERKNEPILSEGRYQVYQEGNAYLLSISHVTTEDSGQYICKAKNSVGETYAAATLKVEDKTQEVLVLPPAHQLPSKEPQGMLEPQVQQESDMVLHENPNKPRFLIKPLSLRVDRGEDAAFSCKLWGQPLPEVVWGKDGKRLNEIYESAHYHVGQQDGGWFQLKIYRTRAPDGGVYTCKAINAHGEAVTGAVLLVEPVPEIHDESLQNGYTNGNWSWSNCKDRRRMAKPSKEPQLNVAKAKKFAVSEGKHAKFRCYVTGKPKPEIVWKKDGIPIKAGRRHMLFEDREGYYTLKVLYCKQQDAGLYICAASNALGDTLSAVHLSVKGAQVQFIQGLQDVEVKERDMAVLECEVPEERISTTWYLEDQKLQPDSKYRMEQKGTRRRLTIHDVGADDDGVYLCEMPDGGRSIAELAVKGTIVQKMPRKLEVLEGENAAFCVELEEEDIDVHWFKDGLLLHESHQTIIKYFGKMHILVFVNTSYQDSGTITLVAGRSKTSCRLRVKAARHCPPACPVGVKMSSDTINGVVLSWDPSPNLQTTTKLVYLLERQEVGSQEWQKCMRTEMATTVEVVGDSVPYEGNYRFRICCINKYGHSGHVEFPKVVHLVPGPKIKTSLKNAMVSPGDDALFSIELSTSMIGNWFLNSTQLKDSESLSISHSKNQHSLIIRNVSEIYNGAEITFIANGVRDSAMLQVEAHEVKFTPLATMEANKKVEVGDPIVLYCEVSNPLAKVHWFKNGVELQRKDGLNIQSEGNMRRIVIQSAEVLHSGAYTCQARGDTITFSVDVEALPEEEKRKSVEVGDPIILHCDVSHPNTEVCWFKDGVPIYPQSDTDVHSEGKTRTLVIHSADFCHTGVYTCQTADDVLSFQVYITGPPVSFTQIPEEERQKTAMELDPVVLHCEVSRMDATVQWMKNGVEIQMGENITVQAEGKMQRLIIRAAELQDAGTYTCIAGENRAEFTVNIREPPVMIVDPKEDVHLDRHVLEEIVLSCELSRSSGTAHWYKDGLRIKESENIRMSCEGPYRRLTILCSNKEDSGEYVCETAGDSVFFQLTITEPLVYILSPTESEVEVVVCTSEYVELACEISHAEAEVFWFRDGVEVDEDEGLALEVDGSHRRLVIPCASMQDSGEYICETANSSILFLLTVEEPPVKLLRSSEMQSDVEKFSGEPIVLECKVSRPNAQVCWMKDTEEVQQSSNITITEDGLIRRLTIHCAELKDSGKYTCDAKHEAIDFPVKIAELPVKILRKADTKREYTCMVSDDIVLECELSRANGKGVWYKDGVAIQENERFCLEEEQSFRSLVLICAELEDSGEYVLDVQDDTIKFIVTVQEPPVKILGNSGDPDYEEMVAGDDLILAVEVSRANAPVEWYCNDQHLVMDSRTCIESYGTLRRLIISCIKPSDSGKYTCNAVDDKMMTVIKIKEPPVSILNKEELNMLTGYENESIRLNVVLSRENAAVRWLKDWTPISNERFHIGKDGSTHFLMISPLKRSDSGEYTCDANTDEMHFSLLVKEMRARFVNPLFNAVAHKDGIVTLRCEVCKPKVDVQWLKDGMEIIPSRRFSIRADGHERSLTIHRLIKEDAGEYVCESKDDRTSAHLTVEMPRVVEFLTELHNTTVLEGEDASFKCIVSPEDAQVVWLMDGERVSVGEKFIVNQNGLCHTLLICKCQICDTSKITAEAEGVISKASLKVQEAQVLFTKKMALVEGEEFGEATLETEVSLESGEVQWMRQGVVIQPGPRHTLTQSDCRRCLTIHNLSLSDRGTYRCETLHDRTQVKLNVEPRKITIYKGLVDTDTFERETASFEVELSHTDVEGVWQKDGLRIKPNNNWRVSSNGRVHGLTLSNLTLDDTGTIVFLAEGLRTSARLQVKETPVGLLRKLSDARLEEGSLVILECELSRTNVEVKWLKNGVEIKSENGRRIYSMGRKRCLQLQESCIQDSGLYSCHTGELSTSCNLEIYERGLELVQGLEDLYVQEEQNAVFMCEVSIEDIPGDWYKNGSRIRPSCTIKMRREGTKHFLLMCNVQAEDSGEIMFVAKQVQSTAYLEVEELPARIVKPLRDRTALQNHRVILECTVSTPRCNVTWYRGDTVLEPSDRVEIVCEGCYHKLVILQVMLEDEGTYSIEVRGQRSTAKLMVEAQSILLVRDLEDVAVQAPGQACFECELSVPFMKPPVWLLNGETLLSGPNIHLDSHGTIHKLIFRQTSVEMSGMVQFTSGKVKSSAHLNIVN